MSYELTEAGLKTSDPSIKILFYNEPMIIVEDQCAPAYLSSHVFCDDTEVCIPWDLIKAAIKPVEGEQHVFAYHDASVIGPLAMEGLWDPEGYTSHRCKHWRVINICQTYVELRELLASIERWG